MPRRLVDSGHPEDGAWGRWARFVLRRPVAVAAVGVAIVAVLAGLGTQLNPSEAQMKYFPGTGTAIAGRAQLAAAGITPGVIKPLDVLVEHGGNAQQIAAKLRAVPGIVGASAPPEWRRGQNSFVEAFATDRRRRPRHPGDDRPRQREPQGNRRDAHRNRRGRPRLPARPVRQLPLRARPRPAPDPRPAHAGVPLDRARGQGGAAESPLARCRRSGSSSSSSRRATAPRSGTSRRPSRSPPTSR